MSLCDVCRAYVAMVADQAWREASQSGGESTMAENIERTGAVAAVLCVPHLNLLCLQR